VNVFLSLVAAIEAGEDPRNKDNVLDALDSKWHIYIRYFRVCALPYFFSSVHV
jgi:hypothetical protein